MGGTRGSGFVSSAADVRRMRGVGGVCEMCMCLARVGVGREDWVWAIPKGSVGRVFGLRGYGWCKWGVYRGLGTWSERVGWCYIYVSFESGFFFN